MIPNNRNRYLTGVFTIFAMAWPAYGLAENYDRLFPATPKGWTSSPAKHAIRMTKDADVMMTRYKGRKVTTITKVYEYKKPYARIKFRTDNGSLLACMTDAGIRAGRLVPNAKAKGPKRRSITFKGHQGEITYDRSGDVKKLELVIGDCNIVTIDGVNVTENIVGWFLEHTDIKALTSLK